MDPRRFLKTTAAAAALAVALSGCALVGRVTPTPAAGPGPSGPEGHRFAAASEAHAGAVAPGEAGADPASTARPYLAAIADGDGQTSGTGAPPAVTGRSAAPPGRAAIAQANRSARAASTADAFVGGVQVFAWSEGRVYEVWTAPLRVTTLTLAPGETVTAKAAGDTVRWRIGESRSGTGSAARTHVLIKPLQAGLETNLVLTTSQRVYLLSLRSGAADAFNAAVAWDYGAAPDRPGLEGPHGPAAVDVSAVAPQGPLEGRYRIEAGRRPPSWAPVAVADDGVRTFVTLSPRARIDTAPALFVRSGGALQLVNYRQADGVLIVDRLFDEAELRLGGRRAQVVRIRRLSGAGR